MSAYPYDKSGKQEPVFVGADLADSENEAATGTGHVDVVTLKALIAEGTSPALPISIQY